MTTEKKSFSRIFDVTNPMKVRVTAARFGGTDDANPPFGQTHGEPPTAQGSFGCGGPRALEGQSASAGGSDGTGGAACCDARATSGGISLGL
jgi:hypothetical protein